MTYHHVITTLIYPYPRRQSWTATPPNLNASPRTPRTPGKQTMMFAADSS